MSGVRPWLLIAVLSLGIAACANYPGRIAPGMSRQMVLERFGAPSIEAHLPAGDVLIYSTAPFGDQAFGALLDDQGQVTRVAQLLTLANLGAAQPGVWTEQTVLEHYGLPAARRNIRGNLVWDYRYRELETYHSEYSFTFDAQGVLVKGENGPDPMFDGGNGRGHR